MTTDNVKNDSTASAMRILIVDDDSVSRLMLVTMLKKAGYETEEAVNGMEAWMAMQRPDAPKIAIIDWMMPEMDGLDVIRRIRALPTGHFPFLILLTSCVKMADVLAGFSAGANDYLTKPYHAAELQARLEVGRRMIDLQDRLTAKIKELEKAFEQIHVLSGIIPICASCKKIRDDAGYWQQVDMYISKHSEAKFTHGFCPECEKKLYAELNENHHHDR
jgi:CheY-like chemotaxis protein